MIFDSKLNRHFFLSNREKKIIKSICHGHRSADIGANWCVTNGLHSCTIITGQWIRWDSWCWLVFRTETSKERAFFRW